jgi:hypothetical protein
MDERGTGAGGADPRGLSVGPRGYPRRDSPEGDSTGIDPTDRLMFWLKVPYVLDVVLGIVGVGYLIAGNGAGWWILLFGFLRAVIGTISLFWIAPRMIAARRAPDDSK